MLEEKIIAVCANRETAKVSVYNVDYEKDKIHTIRLMSFETVNGNYHDIVSHITNHLVPEFTPTMYIVDITGFGLVIANELSTCNCGVPILRVERSSYSDAYSQKVFIDYYLNSRLESFTYYFSDDLVQEYMDYKTYKINNQTSIFNDIKDIAFIISNIITCRKQYKHQERKDKIENNLTEIINICMASLSETNITDKGELDKLVHLIDKANYMRGQY